MYTKITDPSTGKRVQLIGESGIEIIKKYIKQIGIMKGGSAKEEQQAITEAQNSARAERLERRSQKAIAVAKAISDERVVLEQRRSSGRKIRPPSRYSDTGFAPDSAAAVAEEAGENYYLEEPTLEDNDEWAIEETVDSVMVESGGASGDPSPLPIVMATPVSGAEASKSAPSQGQKKLCSVFIDSLPTQSGDSLSEETKRAHLMDARMIDLFKKKCSKSENESYNKWREQFFVELFNKKQLDLPDKGEFREDWVRYYTNLIQLEDDMIEFERNTYERNNPGASFGTVVATELNLQAGQGNYDFDFKIIFSDAPSMKFKYEYKHHPVDKLPQLLSLYDVKNPKDPDKEAIKDIGEDPNYVDGQWWAKYTCIQPSKIPKKGAKLPFEFWEENPFWKAHLEDGEHGIPAIREAIPSLPVITEEDYFCGVKSTDGIPGRSSAEKNGDGLRRNSYMCNTVEDCLEQSQRQDISKADRDWIKKQMKKMNKWLKYMDVHYPYDPDKYKILRFFQILFDYSSSTSVIVDRCDIIRNKSSITKYLEAFVANDTARESLIERLFTEIRSREYNKRFIFYYPNKDDWRIGKPYEDTWEQPADCNVTVNGDNLYIDTASGNRFNFNLRWANTIGLQNPAWKMNILRGSSGRSKLNVEIIRDPAMKKSRSGK